MLSLNHNQPHKFIFKLFSPVRPNIVPIYLKLAYESYIKSNAVAHNDQYVSVSPEAGVILELPHLELKRYFIQNYVETQKRLNPTYLFMAYAVPDTQTM